MYDPIYSQNIGLCGFRCRVGGCTKVVRTYRGITMHCKRVHGLVAQMQLFDACVAGGETIKETEDGKNNKTSAKNDRKPVRSAAERAVLIASGCSDEGPRHSED